MVDAPRDPATLPLAHPLAAVGASGALLVVIAGPLLVQGGLAPLVVGAGVAALVGAPLAVIEVGEPGLASVARVRALLLRLAAGAALAQAVAGSTATLPLDLPPGLGGPVALMAFTALLGGGAGALALAVLQRLHRRPPLRLAVAVPLTLVALACLASFGREGLLTSRPHAPWTLLTPTWSTWQAWAPGAALWGLLAAGAGLGTWSRTEATARGRLRPWLTGGASLGAFLAVAWVVGVGFERLVHAQVQRPPTALVDALCVGPALAAAALWSVLLLAPVASRGRVLRETLAWGIGLAALGASAPAWAALVALPVGLGACWAMDALARQGASRLLTATAALLAVATAGLGFPGVPAEVGPAAGAALALVAVMWAAGTRAVLPEPA